MRSVGITRLTATVVATGKAVTEGGLHYRPDSDSVSRADACLPACSVAVTARPVARRPNLESDSDERAPVREPLPLLFSGFCTHEKTNLFFCCRGRVCVCVCVSCFWRCAASGSGGFELHRAGRELPFAVDVFRIRLLVLSARQPILTGVFWSSADAILYLSAALCFLCI